MVFSQISRATDFSVGAPQKGKRGQTFAPINTEEKLLQLTSFSKPLLVPFEAGVYQETGQETRINLERSLTESSWRFLTRWTQALRAK